MRNVSRLYFLVRQFPKFKLIFGARENTTEKHNEVFFR